MAKKIVETTTMADVAKAGPKAKKVIEKYFGKGCFACPSFTVEPLFMGARQHAVDLEKVLKELNSN